MGLIALRFRQKLHFQLNKFQEVVSISFSQPVALNKCLFERQSLPIYNSLRIDLNQAPTLSGETL